MPWKEAFNGRYQCIDCGVVKEEKEEHDCDGHHKEQREEYSERFFGDQSDTQVTPTPNR